MDQSEIEPERRRQVPTLVWLILAVLLIAAFSALMLLLIDPN